MVRKSEVVSVSLTASRRKLIEAIAENLTQVHAWSEHPFNTEWMERTLAYAYQAQSLIEVLEVADTGQLGDGCLVKRTLTLIQRHPGACSGTIVKELKELYSVVQKLREVLK